MTDRELELQLRAWYRVEIPATEIAPPALRESISAIPGRVGRPLALVRSRRRLGLLAAAAVLLVILGGLLLVGSNYITNIVPPASPEASSEQSPAASALETPDLRPRGLPANAGMFAPLSGVYPMSDTVTWVVAGTAILRTDDAGATWRAVQPENWEMGWPSEGFADADTAYVPTGDGSTISVTHDGGTTWTAHVLDGAQGMGQPIFTIRSSQDVAASYVDPARYQAPKGTGLVVFSTNDGGITWAGPSRGVQPHMDASDGKLLPANGSFLVETAGKFDTKPFENWFAASEDGGVTYTRYEFPTGTLAPKNPMKTVDAIIRGDDGHLLIAISVDGGRKIIPQSLWRNGEDPASWQLVEELPGSGDAQVQFLSATTWVLASGSPSEILWTADAGAHWRTVIPSISLYSVQQPPAHVHFATEQTGWATEDCQRAHLIDCGSAPRSQILFVTKDGGATWTPLGF